MYCTERYADPNMIVGDKAKFAIEFEFSDDLVERKRKMGFGKLWIENQYYGTKEDLIFLEGYLLRLVEELLQAPALSFAYFPRAKPELYERLTREREANAHYKLSDSTFTDDFDGYKFARDGRIFMVWRLINRTFFKELQRYPTDIQVCSALESDINEVYLEAKREIDRPTIG